MLVVADSSPLLALAACGGLSLLDALFDTVRVPRAVYLECTVPEKALAAVLDAYLTDKIIDADLSDFLVSDPRLDRGEAEAIALYRHLQADILLLDDVRARKFAVSQGIPVTGSLGVLVRAKDRGAIPAVRPYLTAMRRGGIYYSERLVLEALNAAGES